MIVSIGFSGSNGSLMSVFAAPTGTRAENLHLAINYALSTVRVTITPTGDPWRISAALFARMIDLAREKLRELDPTYASTMSRAVMGAYIVERGYKSSAPPPIYQPGVTVATPVYYPTVTLPYTSPPVERLVIIPETYTPPAPIYYTPAITPVPQQRWEPEPPVWELPTIPDPINGGYPLTTPVAEIEGAAGADNTILWILGAAIVGLSLGTMGQRRGGSYDRRR